MFIEEFINHLRFTKRYSKHTLIAYENDLNQFFKYLTDYFGKEPDVKTIHHRLIRRWIVHNTEQNISARSINRKISTLQSFYKFLIQESIVENNPVEKVLTPKTKKRLPFFVQEEKMNHLIDECDFGNNFEGLRNRLIIEMLYATGIRRSELINLKQTNVDLFKRTIKVLGKRNKERIVPFTEEVVSSIQAYISKKTQDFPATASEFLFLTKKGTKMYDKLVYRVVNRHIELVSTIEKKSPHVLRHTYATHLLNNGADLNAIKELLGHSSLAATQVYTHNTFEKLNSIYKHAHPRAKI